MAGGQDGAGGKDPGRTPQGDQRPVAFVLGGGGIRGAVQVGMLEALFEAGIVPDLIVGTSIGAINGAIAASDPSPGVIPKLVGAWTSPAARAVYGTSFGQRLRTFASSRTHLNSPEPLRRLLADALGEDATFEGLAVPLMVGAANIERAAEHWFHSGPLIDAVMASSSVPGLLPPTRVEGEHYIDGGIVNSIPIEQAVTAGARTIYVLQVGRVEQPLSAPTGAFETAKVAFEVARRHRYARDMRLLPEGVDVHVLPTGGAIEGDEKLGSYRRMGPTLQRIEQAHAASRQYIASFLPRP